MSAGAWDERYRSLDLVWGAEPNRFVKEHCAGLPVGEAVDVACGEGRNSRWLATLGWTVLGLDFSAVAIDRARRLARELEPAAAARLRWRVSDVTQETIGPASVDLSLVSYVHVPPDERRRLFMMTARAVRPGGHLFVVGHDVRNLTEGVSGPQDATLLYEPGELADMVASVNGMLVSKVGTVQRPTAAGVGLDTVLLARRP